MKKKKNVTTKKQNKKQDLDKVIDKQEEPTSQEYPPHISKPMMDYFMSAMIDKNETLSDDKVNNFIKYLKTCFQNKYTNEIGSNFINIFMRTNIMENLLRFVHKYDSLKHFIDSYDKKVAYELRHVNISQFEITNILSNFDDLFNDIRCMNEELMIFYYNFFKEDESKENIALNHNIESSIIDCMYKISDFVKLKDKIFNANKQIVPKLEKMELSKILNFIYKNCIISVIQLDMFGIQSRKLYLLMCFHSIDNYMKITLYCPLFNCMYNVPFTSNILTCDVMKEVDDLIKNKITDIDKYVLSYEYKNSDILSNRKDFIDDFFNKFISMIYKTYDLYSDVNYSMTSKMIEFLNKITSRINHISNTIIENCDISYSLSNKLKTYENLLENRVNFVPTKKDVILKSNIIHLFLNLYSKKYKFKKLYTISIEYRSDTGTIYLEVEDSELFFIKTQETELDLCIENMILSIYSNFIYKCCGY